MEMMCQCDCEKPGNPVSKFSSMIKSHHEKKMNFRKFKIDEIFSSSRDTLKMHDNVLVMELISAVFANALRIILAVGVNVMLKILAFMAILKQVVDQTIPQPRFVTTEGIVSVENVNVTQEKIH